jgi:Na+-driven multidrug efflux pump
MGPSGVWSAVVVADTLLAVLAIIRFRRGKWKKITV